LLWHLTAREAPAGNIGKLPDEDIAYSIGWRGDPADLIKALVESGWIDEDTEHRLLIHDWPEHCEDAVHMRLARARLFFADGSAPNFMRLPKEEREKVAQFYGEPAAAVRTPDSAVRTAAASRAPARAPARAPDSQAMPSQATPGPEPEPRPATPAPAPETCFEPGDPSSFDAEPVFNRMWERHPRKSGMQWAKRALIEILAAAPDPAALAARIEAVHAAWCRAPDWSRDGGRYCPRLDRWLREEGYLDGEPPKPPDEVDYPYYKPDWAEDQGAES